MKIVACRAILLLALMSAPVIDAQASAPPGMTRAEIALTAPWCRYAQTIGQDVNAYKSMLERYGKGFSHVHHYCWAQVDAMRLYKRRQFPDYARADRAIGNCNYVLSRTDPSFIFWKDTMVLKIRLTDQYVSRVKAINHAEELVRELPEFADGYTILADLLIKSNRKTEAEEVLAIGARKATDKERFEQLKSVLDLR